MWRLGTRALTVYVRSAMVTARDETRDSSNKAIARHFGAIPAYLRQSSAAREFADLALALEVTPRDTSLAVDCKAVVHLPLQKQLAASQVHGDPNAPNGQIAPRP